MCAALSRHEGSAAPALSPSRFRRDGFGIAPAFHCIVAERHGVPVGYAMYLPDYDTDLFRHSVYVVDLYVDNEARRCGIGRALMATIARTARLRDARTLWWNVLRDNDTARAFYRTIGRELESDVVCSVEDADFDRLAAMPAPQSAVFRPAGSADAEVVSNMLGALRPADGIEPTVSEIRSAVARESAGPYRAFTCHIAEQDGKAIGCALHRPAYDTGSAARGLYLSGIYVRPEARRGGVARSLLGAAARHGRERGARYLEWRVPQHNKAARAFFRTFAKEHPEILTMIVAGDAFIALAAGGHAI